MNVSNVFIFSFCLVMFFACMPQPLEIDLPPFEEEIVVFSQVIPDQVMTVALTKTISALDFSEEEGDSLTQNVFDGLLVSDAIVSIAYRDQLDTLFPVINGVYASINSPQLINEKYTLRIEAEDKVLTSESVMLPIVMFDEILPVIERTDQDTLVTLDFKIVDEAGDNWYMINIYAQGEVMPGGLDINSFFQSSGNVLRKTELLSDLTFENNVFEGNIELPDVNPQDSIVVTLSNINEKYFEYLQIRQNSTNFFTEITKEPVSLPTNIEGGLGFFNTHFPDPRFFDLKEY